MCPQQRKEANARETALKSLIEIVIKGRSLAELQADLNQHEHSAIIREMVFGVCRWFYYFESALQKQLKKPLRKKDTDVVLLLYLGMYQIQFMNTSDHAAVNETVQLVLSLRKKWAKALVNALLRTFMKQAVALKPDAKTSFAPWMQKKICQDWPQEHTQIFASSNEKADISLRINPQKTNLDDYCKALKTNKITFTKDATLPQFVRLSQTTNVMALPGYEAGDFYVQDGSAQMASHLLNVEKGMRVLDACAAPGGKTTHIAELADNLTLIALEKEAKRMARLNENINRLGRKVKLLCGDATQPSEWFDGTLFDRILIDAPCSASGIIRRHPDIKVLRRETDMTELATLQTAILNALWPLLKQGGELLYCTCSIFKQENEHQIEAFINSHKDSEEIKLSAFAWSQQRPRGLQVIPAKHGKDGFYYAKLRKINA